MTSASKVKELLHSIFEACESCICSHGFPISYYKKKEEDNS